MTSITFNEVKLIQAKSFKINSIFVALNIAKACLSKMNTPLIQ